MAASKATTKPTTETTPSASATEQRASSTQPDEAPWLGWDDAGSLPDCAGFFKPTANGPWVAGTIRGFIDYVNKDGDEQTMVVLKVARDTAAVLDDDDILIEKGDYIGVSKRHGLKSIFECGPGSRVAFRTVAEKKLDGGRRMWICEVRIDPKTRCARPEPEPRAEKPEKPNGRRNVRGTGGYTRSADPDDDFGF